MLFGEIDIPQELLDSQAVGNLVIFAGAGVSIPVPSNYPNFFNLAKKIAPTWKMLPHEEKAIDQYLGRLADTGIKVHNITKDFLTDPTSEPNSLHNDLLSLFINHECTRLVTTNFDTHFDTKAHKDIRRFTAPALPRGNDFCGLVYLHGCVNDDPKNLVLTDIDFGKAYLSEGWARRFILEVYSHYDILFVGYSFSDTIMSYLTRGLRRQNIPNAPTHFVLSEEGDDDKWRSLGIQPISYQKDQEHKPLAITLCEWAKFTQSQALTHEKRVSNLIDYGPQNLNEIDESFMQHVLTDETKIQYFTRNAKNIEWLKWVEQNGFLQNILTINSSINQCDRKLASWFSQNFVFEYSDDALSIIMRNKQMISSTLYNEIIYSIYSLSNKIEATSILADWVTLLLNHPQAAFEHDNFSNLLSYLPANNEELLLVLFDYITSPQLNISERWGINFDNDGNFEEKSKGSELEWKASLVGQSNLINNAWENIKKHFPILANRLEPIITNHIKTTYIKLKAVGGINGDWDPIAYNGRALSSLYIDNYSSDIKIIITMAVDIIKWMADYDSQHCTRVVKAWAESEFTLLQRLAVYGISQQIDISPDQKLRWLLQKNRLLEYYFKDEVNQILNTSFPKASSQICERLLKQLHQKTKKLLPEDSGAFRIADILNKLKKTGVDLNLIEIELNFLYDRFPEFRQNFQENNLEIQDPFKSPLSSQDILSMQVDEVIEEMIYLNNLQDSSYRKFKFSGEIKKAIIESPGLALSLLKAFEKRNDKSTAYWHDILFGWLEVNKDESEWKKILEFLVSSECAANEIDIIARFLDYSVSRPQMYLASNNLLIARKIAFRFWELAIQDNTEVNRNSKNEWFENAMRHPGGCLTNFILKIISIDHRMNNRSWTDILNQYKSFFNQVLKLKCPAAQMGRIMLMANISFLVSLDKVWATKTLYPLLDWNEDQNRAEQAWHGYLKGNQPSFDIIIELLDKYKQTFLSIGSLSVRSAEDLAEQVAAICCSGHVNPMENDWLMFFIKYADSDIRTRWAFFVTWEIDRLDHNEKRNQWNIWICNYWKRRLSDEPVELSDEEYKEMTLWCISLNPLWSEIIPMFIQRKAPAYSTTAYDRIIEGKFAAQCPNEIVTFILHLIQSAKQPFIDCDRVTNIVNQLNETGASKEKLREICNKMSLLGCQNALNLERTLEL